MNRRIAIPVVVLVVAVGAFGTWWFSLRQAPASELVLYGNVDLRQVDLAFNDSGRVAEVLVDEGDRVKKGQVLARLDTSRLTPQVDNAAAQVAAQQAAVDRLHNGSRPEEVAQARANLEAAKASALNAHQQYDRKKALGGRSVASQQDVDAAKAAMDVADAQVRASETALALLVAGPRAEDIAQGEAQLRAAEAQLALLRQQLADAELKAPTNAVVRSRLMEPGDMASPARPVFSLAIVDPKWVRAYVAEPDLARLRAGMAAEVAVDGVAGKRFSGTIGFISSVAEFTPKAVQTDQLRTSLVYEVRVNVEDPDDALRLGMPATVYPKPGEDGHVAFGRRSQAGHAMSAEDYAIRGRDIRKTFRRETGETIVALDDVPLEIRHGELTALVGPDGAGKTTLIRLVAGLMSADSGTLEVLGVDVAKNPQAVQDRVGYMPQRFGLYEDLSVQENLDLYADLHGVSMAERRTRYPRLLEMTALGPFTRRQAGRLSGGMKQKLGLACTLVQRAGAPAPRRAHGRCRSAVATRALGHRPPARR